MTKLRRALPVLLSALIVGCSDNSDSTIETMDDFVEKASEVPTQEEADQRAAAKINEDNAEEELDRLRSEIKGR